jgi:hypothetical protein
MAERVDEDAARWHARELGAERRCTALAELVTAAADLDRRPGDPPRREVVVHIDADVLADDTAAGRAYLDGGPALSAAQARRMLCESTVVVMLEQGREVLALGRKKRRASKAQRRALLRRDGGCARPGCPETRIERLHAHHLRHWLLGGRTDLNNLVLLCDVDHGLAHDENLVMARRDGRLIVTAPDGRRVWGAPDAAFTTGLPGLHGPDGVQTDPNAGGDPYAGIQPLDHTPGRRPTTTTHTTRTAAPAPPRPGGATRPTSTGRPGRRSRTRRTDLRRRRQPRTPRSDAVNLGATLFPTGEPPLPDAPLVNGERMDLRHVIYVLMTNRDLIRQTATEAGVAMPA